LLHDIGLENVPALSVSALWLDGYPHSSNNIKECGPSGGFRISSVNLHIYDSIGNGLDLEHIVLCITRGTTYIEIANAVTAETDHNVLASQSSNRLYDVVVLVLLVDMKELRSIV
jgi:hypothetical protein